MRRGGVILKVSRKVALRRGRGELGAGARWLRWFWLLERGGGERKWSGSYAGDPERLLNCREGGFGGANGAGW
jgi:hypothetical protein